MPSDNSPHHQWSITGKKKKIKAKSDQASKTTNSQEVQETEEHVKQNEFLAFSICCGEF